MPASPIERNERLGRGVFSSRVPKKIQEHGSLPSTRFLESDFSSDSSEVSMDRLDKADCVELTKIQDAYGQKRRPPRKLQGWLHCPASVFQDKGWPVEASPVLEPPDGLLPNPYHSHIQIDEKGRMGALDIIKAGIGKWEWQPRCDPE